MTDQTKITPKHANIYCAVAAAQLEFGAVTKGSTNPAFKSKYADLADVASVVIPVLARHGVCVIQYFAGESLGAMRTEFVHGESETRVSCDVPLIVDRQNMQGMKSATTYAKRIGLESLSGVAPEDDDGNAAAKAPPRQMAAPRRITADQFITLQGLLEESGADKAKMLAYLKADVLDDLTVPQFDEAVAMLRKKISQKEEISNSRQPITDDEIPY